MLIPLLRPVTKKEIAGKLYRDGPMIGEVIIKSYEGSDENLLGLSRDRSRCRVVDEVALAREIIAVMEIAKSHIGTGEGLYPAIAEPAFVSQPESGIGALPIAMASLINRGDSVMVSEHIHPCAQHVPMAMPFIEQAVRIAHIATGGRQSMDILKIDVDPAEQVDSDLLM